MTHKSLSMFFVLAWFIIVIQMSGLAFAQADIPNPGNYGTPISSEFSGGSIDAVNLTTGGLHLDIPLLDLPGIGQGTHIHYVFDNRVWNQTAATQPSGQYWITLYQDRELWKFQDPLQSSVTMRTHQQTYSGNSQAPYIDYVSFEDEDGTSHQLPLNGFPDSVPVGGTIPSQAYSLDSAGILVNMNSQGGVNSAIDKHGTKYNFNSPATFSSTIRVSSVEDSNGNAISGTWSTPNQQSLVTETLTDTVDRKITITWNGNGDATGWYSAVNGGSVQSISYTDQNGNTQTITINFEPVQVNLALACQGNTGTCGPLVGVGAGTATAQLPGSIELQNGDTYTFTYEPNGLGEISSITLPAGGVISYTWSSTADQGGRTVSSRTVTVNGQSSTWNFNANSSKTQITVTDPSSNDTVYTCTNYTPNPGIVDSACYMTEEDFYSGSASSGALIATKKTTYTITGSVMPTSTTFQWSQTGQVTEADTSWESIPKSSFGCNGCTDNPAQDVSRGNKLSEIVYSYGTGSHGPLLKNTQYNYLHLQNSAYLAPNIADRLSQESIYNCATVSSSCLVAQTTMAYDQFNQSTADGQGGLSATSGTTQHDYNNYSTAQTMRGLATSTSKYVAPNSSIMAYTNYNDLGNPTVTTDGFDTSSRSTTYKYGAQNAFVSTTTLPSTGGVQHTLGSVYDVNTGLLMSATDQNSQTTSYTYDSRMRLLTIKRPDGGMTTNSYPDANHVNTTVMQTSTQSRTSTVVLDGLGRTSQTQLTSDPSGADYVDTTYDGLGRVHSVSNPYRSTSDPTYGLTTYTYDALGRKVIQQQPDGNTLQWCYNGAASNGQTDCAANKSSVSNASWADFSDETGRHWQYVDDALGRVVAVMEPDGSINITASPTVETDYQYDALSDLIQVNQHGLIRTFTYDGLSRLLTASNPESGTVCYGALSGSSCVNGYDANGNLVARTDARGIQTTYSYDALNRLTSKTYSDSTPTAHFNYDETSVTVGNNFWSGPHPVANGIGRMTSWYVGSSEPGVAMKTFSYDPMGRPVSSWQCWASECSITYGTRQTGRAYDLAGDVTIVGNSNDAQIDYTYDGAGRVVTAEYWYQNNSPKLTVPLVSSETYTPFGQPSARNGNETWSYDKRLRVTSYTNKSSPNSSTVNYGYQLSYQPNGNVLASTETSGSKWWTWAYYYDNLNRLHTATSAQLTEGCYFAYDAYGNRTSQQPYGGTGYTCGSFTASYTGNGTGNNNRIDGYCYDASGNLLDEGPCPPSGNHTYTYDAEGRIATALNGSIVNTYGADGVRASTGLSGQTPTDFIYDFDGSIVAHQIWGAFGPQEIWINGRHFGFVNLVGSPLSAVLTQSLTDWLGTERARADAAGNLQATFCNFPFGDQATTCFGTDPDPADNTHFTGKERDAESGNDYFGARYYGSSMGRFLSPDWSSVPDTVPYADFNDPQSLNLYSYAGNNPLTYSDGDGHVYQVCDSNGQNCSNLDDKTFETDESKDQQNGEYFQGGSIYHLDGDGNHVQDGTYSWQGPDLPGDAASNQAGANMIGNGGMGMVNMFMRNMGYTVAGGLIGRGIGLGIEALADGAGQAINTGSTAVYRSVNAAGDVQYVGITNNLARRAGEHAGRFAIEEIPGLSNLSRADAKAVEQVLIETHGLASNGGTLLNKINSIASTNPAYAQALQRGAQILQQVGYFK